LHLIQPLLVDIDGNHHCRSQGLGLLDHVLTDAPDSDNHDVIADLKIGPPGGLIRRRGRVSHDRQVGQRKIASFLNLAEVDGWYGDMTRKPAVNTDAVARHFLSQAPVSPSGFTQVTLSARHHGRNQYFFTDPAFIPGHHRPGNFMPQC